VGFIAANTGALTLVADAEEIDSVFWSTEDGPSFNLGRGGFAPPVLPGTTLGRPPQSVASGPPAWTIFDEDQATPGAPNPSPPVAGLIPLSGAVLRTAPPSLAWYGVPGARAYRVQIAGDDTFAAPIFDQEKAATGLGLDTERLAVPVLPPGWYVWRVQARFGDTEAQKAPFSTPSAFSVEPAGAGSAASSPTQVLSPFTVPLIMQRKDTQLLALEARDEDGPYAWDKPWEEGFQPPYCGRAVIAMVTAFYKAKLSQDRIGFAAHEHKQAGPFQDVDVTSMFTEQDFIRAFTFALGSPPRRDASWLGRDRRPSAEQYWLAQKSAIDAGAPVIGTTTSHAFVITGYGEDSRGKFLRINDPAFGEYDWVVAERNPHWADPRQNPDPSRPRFGTTFATPSYLMPEHPKARSDEEEVSTDADGDGLVDFDEERFGTSRALKDTDQDGVDDKHEIRAWTFDDRYGYASRRSRTGPDWDRDGKRMEVDEDSDHSANDGCLDGLEDSNHDGKLQLEIEESYNFKREDDRCFVGTFEFGREDSNTTIVPPISTTSNSARYRAKIGLKPVEGARLEGFANFRFDSSQHRTTGECVEENTTDPVAYEMKLTGEAKTLADGSQQLTIHADPAAVSTMRLRWSNSCATPPSGTQESPFQPIPWPLETITLVNGVFEQNSEIPNEVAGSTSSGKSWTKMRVEQRRPPEGSRD
jgi:hypothetical protein